MVNVKPSVQKIFEMSGVLKIIPIIEQKSDVGGQMSELRRNA